jgi:hypothetical protein
VGVFHENFDSILGGRPLKCQCPSRGGVVIILVF